MSLPAILETIHERIKQNPKAVILKLSPEEAESYRAYLAEYDAREVPPLADILPKLVILGRKVEIHEPASEN